MRSLTPLEARVLGVLVEKQHTVPDTYPLSLNALVAGCNQKTAREPVINATDAEVLTALDLEAVIYPCPKGGTRFRSVVRERGGKEQFPYLVDPNTGIAIYE